MPRTPNDLLLIGREAELQRLRENVARGRHTLLVGKIGLGKSHLLRVVERELPGSIYLEQIRPLRVSLLALCQALHQERHLALPGTSADTPWSDVSKRLARLNIRELTEVITQSLHDRGSVLILDQLEGLTPMMAPAIERLLGEGLILGATSQLRPALQKVWWAFDRIDLPPLSREEARQLLWALADPDQLADPAMFEAKVLAQADGNPYALVEMVKQVAGEREVGLQAIRDLHHGAGARYLDITPVLLLVGAIILATRFVALGLNDPDLYIIAGSLGAVFFVARYFLYRGLRRRG
jgi:hypothetical protein